jgi:hypothetical protein
MDKLNRDSLTELTDHDKKQINGGVHPLVWIVGFHVAKEAFNDWEAHKEAFNEGYEAAQ